MLAGFFAVTLWAAVRLRRNDERVRDALATVDRRLGGIAEQISAASAGPPELDAGLTEAIGSTIELRDVLERTLMAAEALPAVDGGRISVRRANSTVEVAVRGRVSEVGLPAIEGPPDGAPFLSGTASWESPDPNALRSGLVVPLGQELAGTLAVFSRLPSAFDAEATDILTKIAQRAAPAIRNAIRFLEVQELASTDARTGLGSAGAFEEALPREISVARRRGRPLCLIQIDLDDFGRINKLHSLEVGDTVLSEFGERVRATIRGSDQAFRNSGGADEFFLILPETTREEARRLYGRLAYEIATPPLAGVEDPAPVTMSSGLAELRPDDTPETLRRRAGSAQNIAKEAGKNQLRTDADDLIPPQ